ncbi:BQ2448_5369 [Microbotryum intermedium]|uniref:Cytochrome c oxidase-assembly factor COX23, mitochondrial n=1 Tax=Microbotryum intermedium TaxID=269621 RepID=A0A238F9A1_9BASI|nr:BQ2448_5369 [Microbotryum intermedium]
MTTPQPTGQAPASYNDAFRSRSAESEFADPCEIARQQSMKCLDRNSYNKSKCTDFFQAYRDCKQTWLTQRREDRRAGKDVA